MEYLGLINLNSTLHAAVVTRDYTGAVTNADAAPTYRIYGPVGLMTNGTGALTPKDQGNLTGADNTTPIVIHSTNHRLNTGTKVTISGVLGNTAANGSFIITVVDPNSFSLNGSAGSGSYIGGGGWAVSGLYDLAFNPTSGNGYSSGTNYTIVISYAIGGVQYSDTYTVTVT
jgi:hypothetical protein